MISVMLIAAAIGDGEDWTAAAGLFEKYEKAMYWTAYEILQNREDAEDAVMQAVIKICRDFSNLTKLDTEGQKARIITITRNAARDIYGENARRLSLPVGDYYFLLEQEEEKTGRMGGKQEIFFQVEDFGRLQKYVKKLKEKYQNILLMKYYHELSNKEIARQLHISESTVATQLLRAKQTLKQALEEERAGQDEAE